MPSLKTEASELAVAFGFLGLDPRVALERASIETCFEGSLSQEKYETFRKEFPKKDGLYRQMHGVGVRLRAGDPIFRHIRSLRWSGPDRQASTMSAAVDLLASYVPISVKAKSNVVANPSPHNLIHNLPQGQAFSKNESHWYQAMDPRGYQALFALIRKECPHLSHLPPSASQFETKASPADRKAVQDAIASLSGAAKRAFESAYLSMCHTVAKASADAFNRNLAASSASSSRASVGETLIRWFFRMDAVRYVLCGIDGKDCFAVQVPSLTEWKSTWSLSGLRAAAALDRRQSVVEFKLDVARKETGATHTAGFHTELRWSHGRFCGAPEAKLYKDFPWTEVPFFKSLI